jgi:23S rRNA pseudouridine955/2504/2580 synthase
MTMIEILRESPELLFVRKPAGMSVQPGEKAGRCLIDVLEEQLGFRPFLLHRLDRDTEGVLALAKTRESAAAWSKAIESRAARKLYCALVSGGPEPASGRIEEDIVQHGERKSALTRYRTLAAYRVGGRSFSLLELELGTGRMHQIRIHLASLGCPILADDKHGDWKLNKEAAKSLGVKRLMLCARSLELDGADTVLSPWPDHFLAFFRLAGAQAPEADPRDSGGEN